MVLVAGEALIDIISNNKKGNNAELIPGGSGFNVACALGSLEVDTSFLYPLSSDPMGDLLLDKLNTYKVNYALTERLDLPTPLAFVSIQGNNPSYHFYRKGTVDGELNRFDYHKYLEQDVKIIHLTGFTLNNSDDFKLWYKFASIAKELGCLISLDPNVRPPAIKNYDLYREQIWKLIELSDVVKMSDEDLTFIAPDIAISDAQKLVAENTTLSVVTSGLGGSDIIFCNDLIHIDTIPQINYVDSVGAGDCYSAGYIKQIMSLGVFDLASLKSVSKEQVRKIFNFASTNASINCAKRGCQPPSINMHN